MNAFLKYIKYLKSRYNQSIPMIKTKNLPGILARKGWKLDEHLGWSFGLEPYFVHHQNLSIHELNWIQIQGTTGSLLTRWFEEELQGASWRNCESWVKNCLRSSWSEEQRWKNESWMSFKWCLVGSITWFKRLHGNH